MSHPPLYRGPAAVRHDLQHFIADSLPGYSAFLAREWELPDWHLPPPEKILDVEPGKLDAWPTISVVGGSQSVRTAEQDGGELALTVEYAMQVFVWIRARKIPGVIEGWEAAIEMRDSYASVLAYLFMDRPHLDVEPLGTYLIDPGSVGIDPSDVDPAGGDRFIAGARVRFNLRAEQALRRGAPLQGGRLGTFVTGSIGAQVVPTDEAPAAERDQVVLDRDTPFLGQTEALGAAPVSGAYLAPEDYKPPGWHPALD